MPKNVKRLKRGFYLFKALVLTRKNNYYLLITQIFYQFFII